MTSAILLMAGDSLRSESPIKKQFAKFNNKELFLYPLETFYSVEEISNIFLVGQKEDFDYINEVLSNYNFENKEIYLLEGGSTRQKSVYNALKFINDHNIYTENVIIHDVARPLVSKKIILENLEALNNYLGTSTFLNESDSLIALNSNNEVENYLNREKIKKVQTPQAFKFDIIFQAHEKYMDISVNDDASLLLMEEIKINLINGSSLNFKVTSNEDLELLRLIIKGKYEL